MQRSLTIGLIWSQFAAYHVDRCACVARRLAGRAEVLAVEVATRSETYAWEPSGEVAGARKITLFPGQSFDAVPPVRRYRAMLHAVRNCNVVCIGLSYAHFDAILLSWTLRLMGKRVIVFSDSKFEDFQRSAGFEFLKSAILSCYTGAIVAGRRQIEYFRFLGFRKRPVLPGYDGVDLDRIRAQAGGVLAPDGAAFDERSFVFVGRFVPKKNLFTLLEAYAIYASAAGASAHRLCLAGGGEQEAALKKAAHDLGVESMVDFPGFLDAAAVARLLSAALALILVSWEEQWGLVVNEALAFGLPVIASYEVGARDALVANLINGFVVESSKPADIARAMLELCNRETWERMVAASHQRAWMGDCGRLADSIELLVDPSSQDATERYERMMVEFSMGKN